MSCVSFSMKNLLNAVRWKEEEKNDNAKVFWEAELKLRIIPLIKERILAEKEKFQREKKRREEYRDWKLRSSRVYILRGRVWKGRYQEHTKTIFLLKNWKKDKLH